MIQFVKPGREYMGVYGVDFMITVERRIRSI